MKLKWIIISSTCFIFMIIAIFLFCLTQVENANVELEERRKINEVSMKVIDGTVTSTGAEFIITDNYIYPGIGHLFWFNYEYIIEKREFGKWKELKKLQNVKQMDYDISHAAGSDGIWIQKINWEDTYGELNKGKYRCVKWVIWEGERLYFDAIFEII